MELFFGWVIHLWHVTPVTVRLFSRTGARDNSECWDELKTILVPRYLVVGGSWFPWVIWGFYIYSNIRQDLRLFRIHNSAQLRVSSADIQKLETLTKQRREATWRKYRNIISGNIRFHRIGSPWDSFPNSLYFKISDRIQLGPGGIETLATAHWLCACLVSIMSVWKGLSRTSRGVR